jgi:hypothetical protein
MGFFNNLFKFECSLDPNYKLPMYEYTLGDKYFNWLSVNAANLQALVNDTMKQSKAKKSLVIAAPEEGGLARWLQVKHDDKLRIYIYADNSTTVNKTLVFHGSKQKGGPEFVRFLFLPLPVPVRMFTFDYSMLDVA